MWDSSHFFPGVPQPLLVSALWFACEAIAPCPAPFPLLPCLEIDVGFCDVIICWGRTAKPGKFFKGNFDVQKYMLPAEHKNGGAKLVRVCDACMHGSETFDFRSHKSANTVSFVCEPFL